MNHDKAIKEILDGIDRDEVDGGWWETSAGVEFGEKKQEELLAYVRQLITSLQDVSKEAELLRKKVDKYKEEADSAHGAFNMLANISDTLRVRDFMQRPVDEGVIAMAQRVDDLENALSNLLDMPMHKGFRAKAEELLK